MTPEVPELIREVYAEGLEWLLEHPGDDQLPLYIVKMMNEVGLDPDRTTLRLLMERDRNNN